MKKIFFFGFLIAFLSCAKKELKPETNLEKYNFDNLYEVNYQDTLYIKSKFSECGEWGGHDEVMKVFYVKERKTMLLFERNEVVDCDDRNSKGDIVKKPILKKQFILSVSEKESLMNFISQLTKSKFLEKNFGNSGNSFSIEDSKGNLKISTYGNHQYNLDIYNNLLQSLKIPEVKINKN